MKILILKENLKKGLNIIERIIGRNLTLPILNNILMTTQKNYLNLTATDLELAINFWVLAKVEKEGSIAVPARFLSNLISLFPHETITLRLKDKFLIIEGENYETQLKTFDPEDFPILPKVKNGDFLQVNCVPFIEGLGQIADFTASTPVRPEISGIFLNFQKNVLKMTATDSFRLAEKTLLLEKESPKEYSLIVPQKAIRELTNTLSDKTEKLTVYFSPNQILFEYPLGEVPHPQIQIISRLIEGEYPDYQTIIPKSYKTQVIISRGEFLNQLRTAGLFSGKVNEIKIKIDPKKESLGISAQSQELGQNQSSLSCKAKGEKMEISFNWRFLADGLNQIRSSEIIFELSSEDGPALLKPVGDSSYLYVVMPTKGT
jgi:DNA polymerase-3 subunit beta